MTSKTCTRCLEVKPLEAFPKHNKMCDGRDSRCKECRKLYRAKYLLDNRETLARKAKEYRKRPEFAARAKLREPWIKTNPKAARASNRRIHLRRKFGITHDDYLAMLATQRGKCAICGDTSPGHKYKNFAIDHDHTTMKIRGLLCAECNIGIAKFRESGAVMLSAIQYIEGHSA